MLITSLSYFPAQAALSLLPMMKAFSMVIDRKLLLCSIRAELSCGESSANVLTSNDGSFSLLVGVESVVNRSSRRNLHQHRVLIYPRSLALKMSCALMFLSPGLLQVRRNSAVDRHVSHALDVPLLTTQASRLFTERRQDLSPVLRTGGFKHTMSKQNRVSSKQYAVFNIQYLMYEVHV